MDTAISPSGATATHNQMRDETRGLEPVIMMSSLIPNENGQLED